VKLPIQLLFASANQMRLHTLPNTMSTISNCNINTDQVQENRQTC